MHSPFMRNRQRKLAALAGNGVAPAAAPAAPDAATAAGQEYAALVVQLHDNLRILQDTASHEARKPLKGEFLENFLPWITAVVAADQPVQDEVLLTGMVWAGDIGQWALAASIGKFAIRHGLAMPERYKRSVACFLREDAAEAALADPQAVAHSVLLDIDQLTRDADMPDAAKAKLDKALGRAWAQKSATFDPADDSAPAGGAAAYAEQALQHFRRALALDRGSGVKRDIEVAERRLRDLQPPPAPASPPAAPAEPAATAKAKAQPRTRKPAKAKRAKPAAKQA